MKTTTHIRLTVAATIAAIVATAVTAVAAVDPGNSVYAGETATVSGSLAAAETSGAATHASTVYFDGINVSAIAIGAYE